MVAPSEVVAQVVTELAGHYDEPQRVYHTRAHVEEVLAALRHLTGAPRLHPVLELAAWAHDAVYDPRAPHGSNERASAELAHEVATAHGIPRPIVEEVVALTVATITHEPGVAGSAERQVRMRVFLDADLWILAAPAERFDEYERQVRAEFSFVPEEEFTRGRAAILEEFAQRRQLYLTGLARQEWEPAARSNLSRIGHHGASPHRD